MIESLFAERVGSVPRSFIREILTVALRPEVISFAGGLPNSLLFPVEAIQSAMHAVMSESGAEVLQYSASEGDPALRQWISDRYLEKQGITVSPENILMTNGSQQGLDLLSKVLINKEDNIIIEAPAYLGAIQAFSVYQPCFRAVSLHEDGMDVSELEKVLDRYTPKLAYTVSNFQNPSGISYTENNKREVAQALQGRELLMIDDDPYGELRFSGRPTTPFWSLLPEQTVMLGSFSKVVAPGLRLGWVVAPNALIEKLLLVKQASDLHTSLFPQRVMHRYLSQHSLDQHVQSIIHHYGRQRDAMLDAIGQYFPDSVQVTHPDGGMFLWATLPMPLTAKAVFERAMQENVVFVPGDPFYIDAQDVRTMRLNFSCVETKEIYKGISCIGDVIYQLLEDKTS